MIFVWIFAVLFTFILLYVFSPWKRPFLTESDWTTHRSPWWQLYYASRYINPVRRPYRKSGLAELFSKDMSLSTPDKNLADAKKITVNCVGDLMVRRDIVGEGGSTLWDLVGNEVFSGDLNLANLEFSVNPDLLIEKLLRYSVPESYANPLLSDKRFGKFDLVFCANNHINDSLSQGIKSTLEYLDRENIRHVGANRSLEEQDQIPVIECKGIRIAVVSYTFSTNGIPLEKDHQYGTNLVRFNALKDSDYDPSLIYHHIEIAKKQNVDFIICSNHWGVEFEFYPPERIVRRAHELMDAGIDLIVGHHPHILNPVERYTTKDGREAVALYSLGSLTTYGLIFPITKVSELAKIELECGTNSKGKRVCQISGITLMPTVHSMKKSGNIVKHRLLPLLKIANEIKQGKKHDLLSRQDRFWFLKLEKEYRTFFCQDGINYL